MRRLGPNLLVLLLCGWLLCISLAAAPAAAQLATLVKDLGVANFTPPPSGQPMDFVGLGTKVVFQASDGGNSPTLWATDGTPQGTREICGSPCINPIFLAETLGDRVLFFRHIGLEDELWVTDGTSIGTERLIGRPEGFRVFSPYGTAQSARTLDGRVYFQAATDENGFELWASDGTREGTGVVTDLTSGSGSSFPSLLARFRDGLAFYTFWPEPALWHTDGTAEGTVKIAPLQGEQQVVHAEAVPSGAGEVLVFALLDGESPRLGFSDGTADGTRLYSGSTSELVLISEWFKPDDGLLYFAATDPVRGSELWVTDGTERGTRPVTNLEGASFLDPELRPDQVAPLPGSATVVFLAKDAMGLQGLYVTSGTPSSTRRLLDLCELGDPDCPTWPYLVEANGAALLLYTPPGEGPNMARVTGSRPRDFTRLPLCPGASTSCKAGTGDGTEPVLVQLPEYSEAPLFWLTRGNGTADLWRSDGTAAGTEPVSDFPGRVGVPDPYGESLAFLPGQGILASTDSAGLPETDGTRTLWKVPGAPDEPTRLLAIRTRLGHASPRNPAALGNRLFFAASHETQQRQLFVTSGTPETTTALIPIGLEDDCTFVDPGTIAAESFVAFRKTGTCDRDELWVSDGTPDGTFPVFEKLGEVNLNERVLATVGDRVIFATEGFDVPAKIFRNDGTRDGTELLVDLAQLSADQVFQFRVVGGSLFFVSRSNPGARRLWHLDVETGTTELVGQFPASVGSNLSDLVTFGDDLLFRVQFEDFVYGVWRAGNDAFEEVYRNPLPGGRIKLAADPASGTVYLLAEYGEEGEAEAKLLRYDGNSATFEPIRAIPIERARFVNEPGFVFHQGRLFFYLRSPGHGVEPWVSDGTPDGTRLIADLLPGPEGSRPSELTVTEAGVFFAAEHPALGNELWRTDGTAAGTRLVHDLQPGSFGSRPQELSVVGDRLYFSADDGYRGRELWSLDLSDPPGTCVPSGRELCLRGTDYRATLGWFDRDGNSAQAFARPLTSDTGAFYYRNPDNLETVVKVLDGRPINDHLWTFLASLSNVEYVLDITHAESGISRRYRNPQGNFASFGDTFAFGPNGTPLDLDAALAALETGAEPTAASSTYEVNLGEVAPGDGSPWRLAQSYSERRIAPRSCAPSPERLCLQGGRFAVEVDWRDFRDRTGAGTAVPLTADTGYFWFFDDANVELILKVLDGTELNGNFWVFYGALSNVEYQLTVTDTEQGVERTYFNPLRSFASVGDTGAFPQ